MIHFSKLNREQVKEMQQRCIGAAIDYAQKVGMTGLSEGGCHNLYAAIDLAILGEWERSKENHGMSAKKQVALAEKEAGSPAQPERS